MPKLAEVIKVNEIVPIRYVKGKLKAVRVWKPVLVVINLCGILLPRVLWRSGIRVSELIPSKYSGRSRRRHNMPVKYIVFTGKNG